MRPDPAYAPVAGEPTQLLPAPNDAYVSPAQWHALYGQGIVIKNVSHKFFTGSLLPPTSGVTNIHSFNSILDLDISTDGGNTFQSVRANAPVQVSVANASASTDNPLYDTEMTSLNLTGLPNGIMVRESPTLPSRGMTQINSQSDGTFKVNSFFDIFTELSLDGGATWSPATNGAIRMQLTQRAPEVTTVNGLLPLTNRPYVSPTQWHAAYANGIYISNVTHSAFTANYPPPAPGATNIENFNSTVSGLISTDGGHTFNPFSAPAAVSVNVASHSSLDNNNTRFFDTEMTSMSLSGGNLPGGIMVRESPTKQSLGRTSVRNDSTGYHISSFFDIFTEVSLDGGNTWSAATTQPATMSPTNPPAIGPSSNVQITKTASANSISIGGVVNFIITVTNLGPNASTNINVLDVLPPGLSYDFTSGSSCGPYNPTNGQLTIPVLAAGSACSLTITATATNLGTFTNTATITSASPPNTNANYSASAVVTVTLPPADLVVTKLVSTNAAGPYTNAIVAYAGQTIYFQIGIQNAGPANPTNIVINDPLPPGLTYVASTQYPYNTNTGVWTIGTLVGNGAYFMYLDCVATNLGTFTNLATVPVPSGVTDPNLSNNTASAFVTVTLPPADLFVTKGVSTNAGGPYTSLLSVPTGQMFYFQIGIGNNGPNIASNVVINDLLPPGLTYVTNFTGNPYTYNTNTGVWTVGTVYPNSGTGYMYLVAVAGSGGMVTNAATVPVPNGMSDPNLTNNTGKAIVQVYPVYSISGYVRGCQSNGPAMPFVNVKLSGAATGSTLTTSNGFYSFSNLVSGTYTITPTHPSDTFSPASASLTLNSNTTLPVFTTSTTEIRGRLTYGTNGAPVIGAEVDLTGAAKHATVTDANGVYYFNAALGPGNYTVTPVATNGFVYTPTNANVTISATNCVAQANFNAANRSVLLVAIEVNQAIQDWSNSVPLVKDKATVVRAFLQLPNATNPPVLLQGARLVGTSGGSSLGMPQPPMNTNGVFLVNTTNAAAGRSNLVNSLNFRVPAAWLSGTITLQFVCTNNVTVIPTNVVPANSAVTVTFSPVATPQVKFFGINWTNPAGAAQNISGATMQSMVDRMLATYPVAGVDAKFTSLTLSSASLQGNKSPLGDDTANAYPSLNKINSGLALLRILDSLFVPVGNRIYYGALAGLDYTASGPQKRPSYGSAIGIPGVSASSFTPLDPYGWPGSAAIPGTVGVGTGRQTASHELGHDLGLSHAANGALYGYVTYVKVGTNWVRMVTPGISNNATALTVSALGKCGDPARTNYVYPLFQPLNGVQVPALGPLTNGVNALVFGLDTLTLDTTNKEPVLSPFQYFDLMSYCRGGLEDRWASVFTYQTLLAAINANFTAPPPPPPLGQLRRWLFVRGQVDDINDAAEFQPFVAVDTAEIPPSPPAGSYYLMLRDANGNLLETISFAPTPGEDEDESQPALDDFVIPIPIDLVSQPVPIREIQVSDGTNILSDIMGSTNFPSVSGVTVTATNGGAFTGSGILNLSWTGYDADPTAQLTYTVQYSSAGSTNWLTLAADLTSTMFSIDSQYLAATAQGQMRVIVSDGFNVSDPAYSATFPVNYHAPTVTLYAPMTGSYYVGDQQLYLSASANDPQDGMLTGASLQWTSSLNGPLGSGTTVALEADTLSEGMHLITVTATDAEGLTNSAQAAIYVVRQSPPTLAIQQIGNQIQLTWPSSVTNYVLESTTQLLPMNWTSVTNVPVAADLLQTVNLNLSTTNRFFRLRMP
jgi:uncharacterized repeat protein (TIGR01451 family)